MSTEEEEERKFLIEIFKPLSVKLSGHQPSKQFIEDYIDFLNKCGIQIEKKYGKYHKKYLKELTRDLMDDILKKKGDFLRKYGYQR